MLGFCASSLSAGERAEAYGHESTALMALRSMGGVQQVLATRLLFSGSASDAGVQASEPAVAEMLAWGVAERLGPGEAVRLQPAFAASLKAGLSAQPPPQATRLMDLFVERTHTESRGR
jgi:hypothetical protein